MAKGFQDWINDEKRESLEEGRREGQKKGRKEGQKEGFVEAFISMVNDGLISLQAAAERCGLTPSAFESAMKKHQ